MSEYSFVTLLCCNNYHYYPEDFQQFLNTVLPAAQERSPGIRVLNSPRILEWNWNKRYLNDLAREGFQILTTNFINLHAHAHCNLKALIMEHARAHSIVLKPTISGSGKLTRLIEGNECLNAEDVQYLDIVLAQGIDLMIQEFAPEIRCGEYSLIYISGRYSHAMLKKPKAGEFRCQGSFGGSTEQLENGCVPQNAMITADKIMDFLCRKFTDGTGESGGRGNCELLYVRIDGIMKEDRFVLMEVEAIEPELWLESNSEGLERLCTALLQ